MHENLENPKEVSVGTDLLKRPASKMVDLASFMVPSALNIDWLKTAKSIFRRDVGLLGPVIAAVGTWQSYESIKSLEEQGVPIGTIAENVIQNAPSKLGQVFNLLSEKLSAVDWRSPEDVTRAIESASETIKPGEWGVVGDILFEGIDFSNLSVMDESTAWSLVAILGWHFIAKIGEAMIARDISKNEGESYKGNFTRLFEASWHVLAPTLLSKRVLKSQASVFFAKVVRCSGYAEFLSPIASVATYAYSQDPRFALLALAIPKAISLSAEATDKIAVGLKNMYGLMYRFVSLLDSKSRELLRKIGNALGENCVVRSQPASGDSIHTRPTEKFNVASKTGVGSEGKPYQGRESGSVGGSRAVYESSNMAGSPQIPVGSQGQNENMPSVTPVVTGERSAKDETSNISTKSVRDNFNILQKLARRFHTWLLGMGVLRGRVENAKGLEIGKSAQDPSPFSEFTGEYLEGDAQVFGLPWQNPVDSMGMVQMYNEYVKRYGELGEGRREALDKLIKAKGKEFTPDDLRTFLYPFGDSYEIRDGRNDRGDLVTPPPSEDKV